MFSIRKTPTLLMFLALAACDKPIPTEVRAEASTFPVRINWAATAAPVGSSTVNGGLTIKQYDGFRMDATLAITGAPGIIYSWRIYRGDCATTTVAANNAAPTGLLLFATTQSYPDVTADATGKVNLLRTIAGSLDSLKAYSVRVRVSQTTGWNGTSPIACGNLQRSPGG